jgi:hypothetical protein
MTTRDFGFITLRNAVAYRPDNSVVPPNNVLVTSTNGAAVFSDNIRISTINASTITTSNINISTLRVSTLDANTINTSTINASLVSTTNLVTDTISTYNEIVLFDNNLIPCFIDSIGSTLYVDGHPVLTEGNISSISSLYWDDVSGTIYNKNSGIGTNKYLVGIGTYGTALNATLDVRYTGSPAVAGNVFNVSTTTGNNFNIDNNGVVTVKGVTSTSVINMSTSVGSQGQIVGLSTINGIAWPPVDDALWSQTGSNLYPDDLTANVGIGISTPQYKLDVTGSIRATTFVSTSLLNMSTSVGSQGQIIGLSTINGLAWPPVDDALWSQSGSNLYPDDLTANVGIGTTTPQAKLDVNGNINTNALLNISTNAGNGGIRIFSQGGNSFIESGNSFLSGSANNLMFTNIDNSNVTPVVTMDMVNKRVGINNGTPQFPLDVAGSIRASTFVSTSLLNMSTSVGSQGQIIGLSTINGIAWPPQDDALWSQSGSNLYADDLTANLGLGTTTPQFKLDVVGSIRASTFVSTSVINMSTSVGSQGQIIGLSTINGLAWPPTDDALWSQSGNNLYPDNSAANVGIGITTPQYKLDVAGTTNTLNLIVDNNATIGGNTTIGYPDNYQSPYELDVLGTTHISSVGTSNVIYNTPGTFTTKVPIGVTSMNFEMIGAGGSAYSGSSGQGGTGGYIKGTINVTPGQTITIIVGAVYGYEGQPSGASYIYIPTTGPLFAMCGAGGSSSEIALPSNGGFGGGGVFTNTAGTDWVAAGGTGSNNGIAGFVGGQGGQNLSGGTGGSCSFDFPGSNGLSRGDVAQFEEALGGSNVNTLPGGNGYTGGGSGCAGGGGSSYYNSLFTTVITSYAGNDPLLVGILPGYGRSGQSGYVSLSFINVTTSLITQSDIRCGGNLSVASAISTISIRDNSGSIGTSGQILTAGTGGQVTWGYSPLASGTAQIFNPSTTQVISTSYSLTDDSIIQLSWYTSSSIYSGAPIYTESGINYTKQVWWNLPVDPPTNQFQINIGPYPNGPTTEYYHLIKWAVLSL